MDRPAAPRPLGRLPKRRFANLRATDADGKINPAKLSALIFDQFQSGYDVIGDKVGQAWNAGNYVITGHNRKLA